MSLRHRLNWIVRPDTLIITAASTALWLASITGLDSFSQTEVFGFVTGAACVWLVVRNSIWNWPVGIVNNAVFIVLFLGARLYADTGLQVAYIAISIVGWWIWLHGGTNRAEKPITTTGAREWAILAVIVAASTWAMTLYLRDIHDAAPFLDAITTTVSLAAQWLMARRAVENWLLWLAVDVVYVPLYFAKGLPLTAILYIVFFAMSARGLIVWRRAHHAATDNTVDDDRRFGLGVIAGKFYPFHRGHTHLIQTAVVRCDQVVVLVCGSPDQTIDSELRAAWIKESFPTVDVRVVDQEQAGLLGDHDSSPYWAAATIELLGRTPDAVFSSEDYGATWAAEMGAAHILVDKARILVPVSGTMVRSDPLANLHYLEPQVRAHFVKRICLLGAESTGKTTMARALAEHYATVAVPEVGRGWTEAGRGDPDAPWQSEEFLQIARMQRWLEDDLAKQANRILVCDTDAETTAAFHELYLNRPAPDELAELAAHEHYDLYLLCDASTPFVQDGYRVDGDHRQQMHARYRAFLDARGASYVELTGSHNDRLNTATAAVDALLRTPAVSAVA